MWEAVENGMEKDKANPNLFGPQSPWRHSHLESRVPILPPLRIPPSLSPDPGARFSDLAAAGCLEAEKERAVCS